MVTIRSWRCFISPLLYYVLLCHNILLLQFLNQVSYFVSACVHKLYIKSAKCEMKWCFIVFVMFSVQPVLSGHLTTGSTVFLICSFPSVPPLSQVFLN